MKRPRMASVPVRMATIQMTAPAPSTINGKEGQWILVWKKVQPES